MSRKTVGSTFFSMMAWMPIAKKYGKKRCFYLGASFFSVCIAVLGAAPSKSPAFLLVVSFCAGPGLAVSYVIPWSMLPDVREGQAARRQRARRGL